MTSANWYRLATILGGVACAVVGALVPATAPFAFPAAAGLIGLAIPIPGAKPPGPLAPA